MAVLKSERCLELVILFLFAALWLAAAPASLSRALSPTELIENALPAKMTLQTAGKPDLLAAVCGAVRQQRKSGASLTTVAVAARGEFAGDVVATVLRCAGKVDCEYVGGVVRAAVSARPGAATTVSDAAMARKPNCEEAIQAAVRAAAKSEESRVTTTAPSLSEQGPSLATTSGAEESFDPHEQLALVCDNGTQRAVRESLLASFLRSHAGASVGPCPPIPSPSPLSTSAPSPPPARP